MIKFRQKEFSEYDAMRSLYVELMRSNEWRNRITVIDSSRLIPVLRGNNIVIERFVISPSMFGKDKFRMYLKIGAKAKMPDEVKLPGRTFERNLGDFKLKVDNGVKLDNKKFSSVLGQKEFGKNNKNKNNNDGGGRYISTSFTPYVSLSYEVKELLGDAIKYDKRDRSLVLEFNTIQDAIRALNILPFGINYNLYLLS